MNIGQFATEKINILSKLHYEGEIDYYYCANEKSLRFGITFVRGDIGDLTRDHQEDLITFLHGSHFYQFTNRKLTVYFRI